MGTLNLGKSAIVSLLLLLVVAVSAPIIFDSISDSSTGSDPYNITGDSSLSIPGDGYLYQQTPDEAGGLSAVYSFPVSTNIDNFTFTIPDEIYNSYVNGTLIDDEGAVEYIEIYIGGFEDNYSSAGGTNTDDCGSGSDGVEHCYFQVYYDSTASAASGTAIPDETSQTLTFVNGSVDVNGSVSYEGQAGIEGTYSYAYWVDEPIPYPLSENEIFWVGMKIRTNSSAPNFYEDTDTFFLKNYTVFPTTLDGGIVLNRTNLVQGDDSINYEIYDPNSSNIISYNEHYFAGDVSFGYSEFVEGTDSSVPGWVTTLFVIIAGVFLVLFVQRNVIGKK